jgi:predicted transcriptional regulator
MGMQVKAVMTGTPCSCQAATNVAAATEMMWKVNCGFLPVVEADGKVCGVVTDRDICMALGTRDVTSGALKVGEVCQRHVFTCREDDDIHIALRTMTEARVRRLVVVDAENRLCGVLSMDDILLHAEPSRLDREPELSADEVVRTCQNIMRKETSSTKKKVAA